MRAMAANGEEDLAAEFGTWVDNDSPAEEDDEPGSGDASDAEAAEEPEGAEKLLGKHARWAPSKGLVVELSAEAASALAGDPAKFFAGPGTVRHVSLDARETHVEWEAKPGEKVAYPTGYRGRFFLRIYEPPAEPEPEPTPQVQRGNTKQKVAELRARREAERARRKQHAQRMRVKDEREERARQEHIRMTPAARRRTAETPAPRSAKTPAATPGGAERAQKAVARSSRGVRLPSEQPSKDGRERLEQPILPLDDIEHQAKSAIEALNGIERALERSGGLAAQKDLLLEFLTVTFPKNVDDVHELARAGNTALTRCRKAAMSETHPAFQVHIAKVRSYFSLADYLCILLRRVRKLAYSQKVAPVSAGELPLVPEWGGKLRIQAEMEITKCLASAILLHKTRDSDPAQPRECAPRKGGKGGKMSVMSGHKSLEGKSSAEVTLMEQKWNDPAFPQIGSHPPPGQSAPNILRDQHRDAVAAQRQNRDLDDYLNREFVRDVKTAQRLIKKHDRQLFVAAQAAANGGAGSLAVLLSTLETQAGNWTFLHDSQVIGNTHPLNLSDVTRGHRPARRGENADAPTRDASWEGQGDLKDGRRIISVSARQGYEKKWRASGPYPSTSPVWGQDSWRGERQSGQMHGPTRTVGMYKMMQFLRPSKDPASAAALPVVPKTPGSEFKAHGIYARDTECVVPKATLMERKLFLTGALHGHTYNQTRRALFTPDDLKNQLSSSLSNHKDKTWPPQLPEAGVAAGDVDVTSNRRKQRRRFQSSLLQEMHDTMGPHFDRACMRTPLDGGGEGRSQVQGAKLPSLTSPGLLSLRQSSRPPTREYQRGLLERIEGRIMAHSRRNEGHAGAGDGRGVSSMDLINAAKFERGLTPKLISEGFRSRSVMGTSDTGWPSRGISGMARL